MFRAVIFDFDGLVIDTESAAYEAWSTIYAEYGQKLELSLWVRCVGGSATLFDPVDHLSQLLGRVLDRRSLMQDKERRKAHLADQAGLLPGVLERMEESRRLGWGLGVASSSGREWVEGHARRLGILDLLDAMRTAEDVARVKPSPDLYWAAAAALGVEPHECLVFEDSINGVKAAKAAGMTCIAVPGPVTRGLDFGLSDLVLNSLAEMTLMEIMARFPRLSPPTS